jgi:hypothetical protein
LQSTTFYSPRLTTRSSHPTFAAHITCCYTFDTRSSQLHLRLLSPVTLLRVPADCTFFPFLHLFHAAVAQSSTLSISHKLPLLSHRTFRYLPGCHTQLASRGLSEALRLTTADCAALLRSAATDYRCHRSRICLQEGLARCAKWHRYRHAYRIIRRRDPPAHGTPQRSQPAQVRNLAGSGPQLACERWREGSPGALDAGDRGRGFVGSKPCEQDAVVLTLHCNCD